MVLGVHLDIILDGQPAGHGEMAPGHAFEVGRHGSGLRIDDNLLSRRHFVLETVENDLFLEDLGSANGTYLNGDEVKGRVALKDGDRIEAGKSALIVHLSSFEAQRIGETGWLVTEIPAGWQVMPHLGLKREGGGATQSVICAQASIARGQSLDEYVKGELGALAGFVAELAAERLDPGEIGAGDRDIVASLAYRFGGKPVHQYQYYVQAGSDVGILTWTKPPPSASDDLGEFGRLIGHLSFNPPEASPEA